MPDDDTPGDAAIEDQLRQARQALSDAEGARNANLSDAVVVNRIYYACFHAAQAALYGRARERGTVACRWLPPLPTRLCFRQRVGSPTLVEEGASALVAGELPLPTARLATRA